MDHEGGAAISSVIEKPSSVSHTPGPWKSLGAEVVALMITSTLTSGRRVPFRVMTCKDGDRTTVQANARLIAAAPDMLAALKDVATYFENTDAPLGARVRAAIAKATGA
jgi:hypothetical protein